MMAANPTAETISPLHALMTGLQGSPNFVKEVPTEVMSSLQLEFTKTLRNLDDHMGNLLGLATFAQISTTHRNHLNKHNGASIPSWLLNIQHFFGPKRGMKTLDLVVLRVILACSSNCNNLTSAQAAESIRLAICVADAVELDQKKAWIASNSSKIVKLCEKVTRENLNREIQIMVRTSPPTFIYSLADPLCPWFPYLGCCLFAFPAKFEVSAYSHWGPGSPPTCLQGQPSNLRSHVIGACLTPNRVVDCEYLLV